MLHFPALRTRLREGPHPGLKREIALLALLCTGAWAICCTRLPVLFALWRDQAALAVAALFLCALLFVLRQPQGEQRERQLFLWLLLAGFALRFVYVLSTVYTISPNDIGSFTPGPGSAHAEEKLGWGHLGYLDYLCRFGRLPSFDPREMYGYYNPPLHHILMALWLSLNRALGLAEEVCRENLQLATLFWASCCAPVASAIFRQLGVRGKWLLWSTACITFFPFFIYQSACVGNDILQVLLVLLTLYFGLRWYHAPSYGTIAATALCLGLGMLTKLNAVLLAPALAALFALVWWKRRKSGVPFLRQFALFAGISLPLGLYWTVRCWVLYRIPLGYVQGIGSAAVWQDVSTFTLWQRLGRPALSQLSYTVSEYIPSLDCNIWMHVFRTAAFGETPIYAVDGILTKALAWGMLYAGILLCVLLHACAAAALCKRHAPHAGARMLCAVAYGVTLVSFVVFCLRYPFICSQHFRYIAYAPVLVCGLAALWLQQPIDGGRLAPVRRAAQRTVLVTMGAFCAVNAAGYLMTAYYSRLT